MTSYTSQPDIPTLSPVNIYAEDTRPINDQINDIYTDISNIVNDKKRRDTYLLQEDITIDVWVDQRSVFRKTVATGALTAGATNTIAHGITTLSTLVDVRVMVTNGTNQRTIPYAHPTAANAGAVDVDATNIVITLGAGFCAGYSVYAIIQYTKV
jgi:hypothetical protein